MKRTIGLLLISLLLMSSLAFALSAKQEKQIKSQIKKLRTEISQYQKKAANYQKLIKRKKISKAKGQKQLNSIKNTIAAKNNKIMALKEKLTQEDKKPYEPPFKKPVKETEKTSTIIPQIEAPVQIETNESKVFAGYFGGTAGVGFDYVIQKKVVVGAKFGVGNSYTIVDVNIGYNIGLQNDLYLCPTLNYDYYSSLVDSSAMPLMPSRITRGGHVGAGAIISKNIGGYVLRGGYVTSLGLLAEIGYIF